MIGRALGLGGRPALPPILAEMVCTRKMDAWKITNGIAKSCISAIGDQCWINRLWTSVIKMEIKEVLVCNNLDQFNVM